MRRAGHAVPRSVRVIRATINYRRNKVPAIPRWRDHVDGNIDWFCSRHVMPDCSGVCKRRTLFQFQHAAKLLLLSACWPKFSARFRVTKYVLLSTFLIVCNEVHPLKYIFGLSTPITLWVCAPRFCNYRRQKVRAWLVRVGYVGLMPVTDVQENCTRNLYNVWCKFLVAKVYFCGWPSFWGITKVDKKHESVQKM